MTASNKYLEKIAEHSNHVGKGLFVSPAWQEHAIAKQHGKEGPKGFVNNVKSHFSGQLPAVGRSFVEGLGTAAVGAGIGALVAKKVGVSAKNGALAGGYFGAIPGEYHGFYAGIKNHGEKLNSHYSHTKASALTALTDLGYDFDEALALVNAK